jgi:phosphatidylinositol phospholipase C delta
VAAIGEYAFEASPYPLIISLENHCSLNQQVMMAELIEKYLGKYLIDPSSVPPGPLKSLPSPAELKHKILIKGKAVRLGT